MKISEEMKPWTLRESCPKCSGSFSGPCYVKTGIRESLSYRCLVCGYKVEKAPHDSESEFSKKIVEQK